VVRLYGNADDTQLTYAPAPPPGAPSVIHAGQVVDLGIVYADFEVSGDHEFAVSTFMLGHTIVDSDLFAGRGDPSQTNVVPVEQFRKEYVFLAPHDYDVSFADIVAPDGAALTLDGQPVAAARTPIGNGYAIVRVQLGPGQDGAHRLASDRYVGLQVMGYGFATSYHYPGGMHLMGIAPPPPIIP
jgi:hypothetical protein